MTVYEKDFLKSTIGDTVFFERNSCEVLDFRRLGHIIQVKLADSLGQQWVNIGELSCSK